MRKLLIPNKLFVCIKNKNYQASLEMGKFYRVLVDPAAQAKHLLRVVDESGEDYLYPEKYFKSIHLPAAEQKVINKVLVITRPRIRQHNIKMLTGARIRRTRIQKRGITLEKI